MNKKPTYKELEDEKDYYISLTTVLILLSVVLLIGFILFIFKINYIQSENTQLKDNCNSSYECKYEQVVITGDNFNLYLDTNLVFNSSEKSIIPSISFVVKNCEVLQ